MRGTEGLLEEKTGHALAVRTQTTPAHMSRQAGRAFGRPCAVLIRRTTQAVLSEPEQLRAMFDVGYLPPNAPPDKSRLDNATLLPVCRKPLLTPVSYPDTVISSGGDSWSTSNLSSGLSSENLESGEQKSCDPSESP